MARDWRIERRTLFDRVKSVASIAGLIILTAAFIWVMYGLLPSLIVA